MPNLNQKQMNEVLEALEELRSYAHAGEGDKANNPYQRILEMLSSKPVPAITMAEIEWHNDEHVLAEAEHSIYGKVIMLYPTINDEISILDIKEDGQVVHFSVYPEHLTPTGRHYTPEEGKDD